MFILLKLASSVTLAVCHFISEPEPAFPKKFWKLLFCKKGGRIGI
jgi:hypothetical protein